MRSEKGRALRTLVALGLGASVIAGACGGDTDDAGRTATASSAGAAAESPYCDLARSWALHEIVPLDESDPAAVRPYWSEYVDFVEQSRDIAPDAVRDQWMLVATVVDSHLTPLLEKYGFAFDRLQSGGTAAETTLFDQPGPELAAAGADVVRYASEVCAAQQPPAAQVTFAAQEPGPYCEAVGANDEMVAAAFEAGARPGTVRAVLTAEEFQASLDRQRDHAPAVISDDVDALNAWWRERQAPLWEKYGYDIREAMREGSPADREVIQSTAPAIRDHFARALAYEEQVCGR